VDRSKPGSKHHLVVDGNGTPLAVELTAANVNEVTRLVPQVASIPPVRGKAGAPLTKPKLVMADRGYDSDANRMALSGKGIRTEIARRNTEHGSGLGVFRYVVEQTIALFHQFRRLRVRDDRDDTIHEAFMSLACSVICWRRLHTATG
jgi:transposase